MAEAVIFRQINLVSPAKHYTVELVPGINVIKGPIFTGKSSIMELINYACGSKTPLKYPEIKKCSDLLLYLTIGNEPLTIQRSLQNSTAKAKLYLGTIDQVLSDEAKFIEVSPRHEKGAMESISRQVLERLGLSNLEVKSAPTQAASDTNPFTIRDLFTITYVNQTRMGANPGFFETDPFKQFKWSAAFQIVHGLFDEKATALSKALKDVQSEKKQLEDELKVIQGFLSDSHVPATEALVKRIGEIVQQREQLEAAAEAQKEEEVEQLGVRSELLEKRQELVSAMRSAEAQQAELDRALQQLGRLQVQYQRELNQLEFLRESDTLLSAIPVSRCPACLQALQISLNSATCYACHKELPAKEQELLLENQLRSLQFRLVDLEKYSGELSQQKKNSEKQTQSLHKEISETDRAIELVRKRAVFPKDRQLLEAAAQITGLDREEEQCRKYLDLRKRATGEGSQLLSLQERINSIKVQLDQLNKEKPAAPKILSELSVRFSAILKRMRFPWTVDDAHLDSHTYLPIVREQNYTEIRSNGAISLIQAAWHFAVLEYALDANTLFPRCLLLDSPLNHVGKADSDPEFRDQQIVDQFYAYLRDLNTRYAERFQCIICDNHPPISGEDLVQVEFTGDPNRGRYGLIDDEIPPS